MPTHKTNITFTSILQLISNIWNLRNFSNNRNLYNKEMSGADSVGKAGLIQLSSSAEHLLPKISSCPASPVTYKWIRFPPDMEGSHVCKCYNRPLHYSALCFLYRYCFLGFGWNERVVASRDNCRLLLVRLKMDGWALGKTKVFLKYYHVEYLNKLYEDQVSHILLVISWMTRLTLTDRQSHQDFYTKTIVDCESPS